MRKTKTLSIVLRGHESLIHGITKVDDWIW